MRRTCDRPLPGGREDADRVGGWRPDTGGGCGRRAPTEGCLPVTAGAPRRRWRYREPAAREQGEPEAEEDPAGWACLSGEAVRDRRAGDHAEKDAGAAVGPGDGGRAVGDWARGAPGRPVLVPTALPHHLAALFRSNLGEPAVNDHRPGLGWSFPVQVNRGNRSASGPERLPALVGERRVSRGAASSTVRQAWLKAAASLAPPWPRPLGGPRSTVRWALVTGS